MSERHSRIPQALHFVGNLLIRVDGHSATAETYVVTVQHLEEGEMMQRFVFGGRYIDRFEKRDDCWRITRRVEACEWTRYEENKDDLSNSTARRSVEDPSYRILDDAPHC